MSTLSHRTSLAPFPRFGVALQLNNHNKKWLPWRVEPLDALEILLDELIGPLDSPQHAQADSVQALGEDLVLLGHANRGGDFGFDPLETSSAMQRLVPLVKALGCPWVTNHSFYGDRNWADVFPSPVQFSPQEVRRLGDRAKRLQEAYGVPLGHENAAYFRACPGSTMPEAEFIAALVDYAGTYIHLDIHNLYCNVLNLGFSASQYLDTIPLERVMSIHLAGGAWMNKDYIDLHNQSVPEPVWELLDDVLSRGAPGAVIIEYEVETLVHPATGEPLSQDESADVVRQDLDRARQAWDRAYGTGSRRSTAIPEQVVGAVGAQR